MLSAYLHTLARRQILAARKEVQGCTLQSCTMAYPAWPRGQPPLEPYGFPCEDWSAVFTDVPRLSCALRVALPCGGIDAFGHFCNQLGIDWCPSYYYDVAAFLEPYMKSMYGPWASHFGIGPCSGDVTVVDFTQWEDIDVLVAGPPCPPWSSIGMRYGADDKRAQVFTTVSNMVKCHGRRALKIFIIEMVCAQDNNTSGSNRGSSFYKDWLTDLAMCMPDFCISSHRLNSADFMVPQHRLRLYTVGVRKSCSATTSFPVVLPLPRQPPKLQWRKILHPALSHDREHALTKQQQLNLFVHKHIAMQRGAWENPICISVDRDPLKGFGSFTRYDGLAMTLRCSNDLCWLLVMDADSSVHLSRPIHPLERFALQGFSARYARELTKNQMLQVTGNAMSVPVVGAVFLAALRCLATAAQAQSLPRVQFGFNARAAMMQRIAKKIMEVDAQRFRYEESLALLDQLR